jgi:replication initiation and membrane attachment protein DnaB
MSQIETNTVKKPNGLSTTADFADFKIVHEDWTLNKLADNSLLRSRVILSGVLIDKNLLSKIETHIKTGEKAIAGLSIKTRQVFEVEPPTSLRGLPDSKAYSNEELKSCIVEEDMDFETMHQGWNIYELKNGLKIKLRISIVAVHRTSKFDNRGMPVYMIDSNVEAKTELPERLRKLVREKSKVRR